MRGTGVKGGVRGVSVRRDDRPRGGPGPVGSRLVPVVLLGAALVPVGPLTARAVEPGGAGAATTTWSTVSTGSGFTCGIRTDDTLWCWGENSSGRLGDGTDTPRTAPAPGGGGGREGSLEAGTGRGVLPDG